MSIQKLALRLLGLGALTVIMVYVGCSSNDEPKPFDCSTSSLSIEVLPVGITNPSGCNNTGTITATAAGGSAPFTYSLNASPTFQSSSTFANLGPGSYSVTVKDNNGCTKTVSNVVLTTPGSPTPGTPVILADTECSSDNGSITVSATGGTGTLTYSKDGTTFQANGTFSNLRAGNVSITIKDEANCTVTVNATVPNGTGISYVTNVRPLFQNKCDGAGCHPANGDWFNYSIASNRAATIKQRTANNSMPPGGGLSGAEKDLIACWVDHGAPEN